MTGLYDMSREIFSAIGFYEENAIPKPGIQEVNFTTLSIQGCGSKRSRHVNDKTVNFVDNEQYQAIKTILYKNMIQ